MFKTQTVFILGAGISHPYGFPLGIDLINLIADNPHLRQWLAVAVGPEKEGQVQEFTHNLRRSGAYSIDSWLERNESYMDIGKYAIAAAISMAEAKSNNFHVESSDDWFRWVWNRMSDQTRFLNLTDNKITFITFNYDRLFESKLEKYIKSSYTAEMEVDKKKIYKALCNKIIHVHGSLSNEHDSDYISNYGALNYSIMLERPFTQESARELNLINGPKCKQLAQGIRIVCEDDKDKNLISTAREAISKAERIVFLGFGYDQRNLETIDVISTTKTQWVDFRSEQDALHRNFLVGTAQGKAYGERLRIEQYLNHRIKLDINGMGAVEFCRNYVT